MKKIQITKEERKALRKTRKIWLAKLKRFQRGDKVTYGGYWESDDRDSTLPNCPLCDLAGVCGDCVYMQAFGRGCEGDGGHLTVWTNSPTKRTCKTIIRLLDKLIEMPLKK